MDRIICTTLNAFRESWPDVDTSVWDILAGRIREMLLCPECHEPIFTNPLQKNITILTDRRMIHSVCLECPATKAEEKNDVSQIKASQDIILSNHNADMVEVPIIKEQEVLEPISYPENSTLHNNSRNSLETSSAENDLISNSEIKQQTQDITNLQDVCSIEEVPLGPDISSEKAPLEDREIAFLDEEYKKKVSNEIRQRNREKKLRDLDLPATSDIPSDSTSSEPSDLLPEVTCGNQKSESSISSHPISNNPVLSEQNAKIKAPEIDIQPLIQELLIEPSKEDCIKIVNVEESPVVDQSPAIELAYLFQKTKFAEINTIRAKQDEIMSWYCYRRYFEKRHGEILPGILKNGLKKAYELASGQIYDEMLQYLSGISRVNLRKRTQLTKPIYMLFSEIGEDKIMRIKSYSANKLSKLTDMQIDTIKNHFTTPREKNSRTHVISEMITSDATANAESEVNIPTAPIPSTHVSAKRFNVNSSNDSSRNGSKNKPTSSRTPIPRTNINKMECLYQYAVEHGLDPEKFSIVTEADKKRWAGESFRGILEVDMGFYCGAIERKEDPRKYHKFLTDRERMIGEELLRRGILESRKSTAWLDNLMKEWEKTHTQFIQVFGQASSRDSSSSKKLDTKVEVVPPIPQPNNPTHVQARNKVLKLYPDISFHSKPSDESEDVYRCRTKSSICPSCKTNHKENIVGRYCEGSYLLSCMYKMKGLEVVVNNP
ncbi:hypothetical protein RclHR1_11950003 [Rhizophagus clarus]|uniref:Uncharacterized protein n=1 Tax=Rhizophagus clarus TaxID=94130 RepID=A0A2Z6Q755_9GLOM|nr:hypothetical protein RclHR1_11950003 [Rhizophagus clarus]